VTVQIIDCEQGSPEWIRARLGIPTASEFHSVMAKGEGKTRKTYMLKLLGERLTGEPQDSYSNGNMERGKTMEAEAVDLYAFMKDRKPKAVGFIRNGDVGCSPDRLLGKRGMVQVKTKLPHLHLELLLADKFPPEHKAQVQGELWVAEREYSDFVCYWPKLPLFVKRVYRDEEYIKTIQSEVQRFLDEMNELQNKIAAYGRAA
jgi:hypothetical protein